MDNTNEELQVEQETAEVEETTTEETTEETQEEDTVVISKEKFKAMQKKAIAYDASHKAPKKETITNNNTLTREEAILFAKGFSEEAVEKLNQVAKATGKTLTEAQNDELFTAWQEKKEAEAKAEKARLGASKSSGSAKSSTGFTTPGLSAEEHKKLWKETMGR